MITADVDTSACKMYSNGCANFFVNLYNYMILNGYIFHLWLVARAKHTQTLKQCKIKPLNRGVLVAQFGI